MSSKLYFVTDGVGILSVFEDRDSAEQELLKYQDDSDFEYYSQYGINIRDIEDYPEEFDMALGEGLLD